MTPLQQLVSIPLVQCSRNQQDDVINHVGVAAERSQRKGGQRWKVQILPTFQQDSRHVVQELAQRFNSITANIVELVYKDLGGLFSDSAGGNR